MEDAIMNVTLELLANLFSNNEKLDVNSPIHTHNLRIQEHLTEIVNKISRCEPYEIEIKGKIRVEIDSDDQISTQFLPESGRLDQEMIVEALFHLHGENLDSITNIDLNSKV